MNIPNRFTLDREAATAFFAALDAYQAALDIVPEDDDAPEPTAPHVPGLYEVDDFPAIATMQRILMDGDGFEYLTRFALDPEVGLITGPDFDRWATHVADSDGGSYLYSVEPVNGLRLVSYFLSHKDVTHHTLTGVEFVLDLLDTAVYQLNALLDALDLHTSSTRLLNSLAAV